VLGHSGLDQSALSALAGLAPAHVNMILRGKIARPSATTLLAICDVLGVSLDWLLRGGDGAPTADHVRAAVQAAQSAPVPGAVAAGGR